MSAKPEAERRFLLKNMPVDRDYRPVDVLSVRQFYTEDGVRFRHTVSTKAGGGASYYRTVKTRIESGVNLEDETPITFADFYEARPNFRRCIEKQRTIIGSVEGLKWEVDTFWTARLVIAEIELPDIKYPIELPDWLQSELIMEVTGMEEFSNYRLSVSYEP